MADDADLAAERDERAMARFERALRQSAAAPAPPAAQDCVDCGAAIPAARLAAWPRTRRCMPCASDVEQGRLR